MQRAMGFETYLYYFSRFKSAMLRLDENEGDFNHFLKLIKEEYLVLDIGANIGIMTVHLCKKVTRGHVYAFEPVPYNLHVLKKILSESDFKNVTVFDCALGNENRESEMILPIISGTRMQGLSHMVDEKITEFNNGEKLKVRQKKLDDIEALKDVNINAIKIDVENFEYQVFIGAEQLLRRCKPIIYCELWDNQNRQLCFSYLKNLGYDVFVLNRQQLLPNETGAAATQNFFFLPAKANNSGSYIPKTS